MLRLILILCTLIILVSCGMEKGKQEELDAYQKMTCYFFFIDDCPASRNNLPKMQRLADKYAANGLEVIGIVSDPEINEKNLAYTLKEFNIDFEIVRDSTLSIAKEFQATTTPQTMLYDSLKQLLYNGALDDYYVSLSRHKNKARENYVENAILAHLQNQEISVKYVRPIGCIINFDYFKSSSVPFTP